MTRSAIAACLAVVIAAHAGCSRKSEKWPSPPLADLERGDFLWLSKFEGPEDSLGPLYGPVLKRLRAAKVPTSEQAEDLADQAILDTGDGPERQHVVDLVAIGVDVPGFASKGDFVWIVRSGGLGFMTEQEVWVSSTTGKAKCVLPSEAAKQKAREHPFPDLERGDFLWLSKLGGPEDSSAPGVRSEDSLAPDLRSMLKRLRAAKVPTAKGAECLAREEILPNDPNGSEHVVGLVTIAADLPGFASKGDFVWIVRSVGRDYTTEQEVWVSSTTGKATYVLPSEAFGRKALERRCTDIQRGEFLWLSKFEGREESLGPQFELMLKRLRAAKVPTSEQAEPLALQVIRASGDAYAAVHVVGLVTIGADVPGFASKGDLVWIVRSVGHDFMVQEVWVSSTTGKATCVLPSAAAGRKAKEDERVPSTKSK